MKNKNHGGNGQDEDEVIQFIALVVKATIAVAVILELLNILFK